MRRFISKTGLALLDLVVLSASLGAAFFLRFDGSLPPFVQTQLIASIPFIVSLQFALLTIFGVRRSPWECVSLREVFRILLSLGASTAALIMTWHALAFLQVAVPEVEFVRISPGVIGIDATLSFASLAGARAVARLLSERAGRRGFVASDLVPTMLIGANTEGILVAKEIGNRPDLGIAPVGFLDDDPFKEGQEIHGVTVHGGTKRLVELCLEHGARQVLITSSSMHQKDIRRIARLCEEAGLEAKIVPGVFEIVGWRSNLSRIRKVAIEDLLGRDPVVLDIEALEADLRDRAVLVTGAGGSIGSEICRQVCAFEPSSLVLVEQAENNLFHIHRELAATFPGVNLSPCIADVCDAERMRLIFRDHRPEVVFHAAAHKHVPMMEWNPGEAIKNNVIGSKIIADLAHAHETRQFVLISTDKAVNPTSMMGASKRLAEIYVQALSQHSSTRFVTVRFGNVLGSAGSVIPIFQEQIAKGGPVTVTHPEMRRYFMTIPEACQLVLEAGSMGSGGEIFVLDMGRPVKIVDLARDLISLSGLRPDEDIEIVFSGIRPGEKLFEELCSQEEEVSKTRHPKIFIGKLGSHELKLVAESLDELRALVDRDDPFLLRKKMLDLVPEFQEQSHEADGVQTAG